LHPEVPAQVPWLERKLLPMLPTTTI
jgi:hypothetical protein